MKSIKREITLKVDGLKISGGLCVPEGKAPYPAVCICHGIPSGTIDPDDAGYPGLAARFADAGFAAFWFNFRGSRNSEGNIDMPGWTRDLTAALDYLWAQPEVDKSKLAVLGYSAGAGVAICVAGQDKRVAAVVSCAAPADLSFIAEKPAELIKYFRGIGIIRDAGFPPNVAEWVAGWKTVNPQACVGSISPRPVLIMHGTKDDMVPIENAHKLYAAAREPKELMLIEDAGHQMRRYDRAVQAAIDWLKKKLNKK